MGLERANYIEGEHRHNGDECFVGAGQHVTFVGKLDGFAFWKVEGFDQLKILVECVQIWLAF